MSPVERGMMMPTPIPTSARKINTIQSRLKSPARHPPNTYKRSPLSKSGLDLNLTQSFGKIKLIITMNNAGMLIIIYVIAWLASEK